MTAHPRKYTKNVALATDPEPHAALGRRYGPNRTDARALHASARSKGRRAVRQAPTEYLPPPPPPLPRCHRSQACRADSSSNDGEAANGTSK
jgi:hypothetical protein